jgi:hypothetical protein
MAVYRLQYKTFSFAVAGDGLEQSWTIPHGTKSVAFEAVGGSVAMRNVTGSAADSWVLAENRPEVLNTELISGHKIYFTAAEGVSMRTRRVAFGEPGGHV